MKKPTLIYAYDPLCGWCFGFHPVMEKLAERFKDKLDIRVIPGGLAIGENAQSIREGYSYIIGALKQVEDTTGVEFGQNFKLLAEEGSYIYDSMPSCKAQTVINNTAPELSLNFAGKLQHAIFVDGKNLNQPDTFVDLLKNSGVDTDKFIEQFESEDTHKQTMQQFEWCRTMGASGFPTLLLEINDEVGLMSKGYRPYDTLESHLHHLLNNLEKLSS